LEEILYVYRKRTYVKLIVKWDPPSDYLYYVNAEIEIAEIIFSKGTIVSGPEPGEGQFTISDINDFFDLEIGSTITVTDPILQKYTVFEKGGPSPPYIIRVGKDTNSHPAQSFSYIKDPEGYISLGTGVSNFRIDPIEENETYSFQISSVSVNGDKGDPVIADYFVVGISQTHPPSPTDLVVSVSDDYVYAYSKDIFSANLPDFSGWEFRFSPSVGLEWYGALFVSLLNEPNLYLSHVIPGTHQISLNTLSTNSLYGEEPKMATFTISDPPAKYSEIASESLNFNLGVHNNTEVVSGKLQCKHISQNKTGTWTSEVFKMEPHWIDSVGTIESEKVGLAPPIFTDKYALSDSNDYNKLYNTAEVVFGIYGGEISDMQEWGDWRGGPPLAPLDLHEASALPTPDNNILRILNDDIEAFDAIKIGNQIRFYILPNPPILGKVISKNSLDLQITLDGYWDDIYVHPLEWRYPYQVSLTPTGPEQFPGTMFSYGVYYPNYLVYAAYSYSFNFSMEPYNTYGNMAIDIYSSSNSSGPFDKSGKCEIFSTLIKDRFMKVSVTITDPGDDIRLRVDPTVIKIAVDNAFLQ